MNTLNRVAGSDYVPPENMFFNRIVRQKRKEKENGKAISEHGYGDGVCMSRIVGIGRYGGKF